MKVYLDYVFFINFLFDFILLLGISIVLKRNISKTKLFIGSVIGGLSGFIIVFNISSIFFFILKLFLGLFMIIITFSYKNIKYTMNNFIYLIILSVLLGGSLYFVNIEFSKMVLGTYFVNNKFVYIFFLLIIGFIVTLFYSKYINKTRKCGNYKYKVVLDINNKMISLVGYLDSGNNLMYKNRPVLILNRDIKLDINYKKVIYIPFVTMNGNGLLKCVYFEEILVNSKKYKNIYLGLSNDKFHLYDADIILNVNLWEDEDEKNNRKINAKT